jgi:DNA-binding transcriptional MerR regulator
MSGATAVMKVGELASAAGIAPDTIRYYEKIGLLAAPPRTHAGYRAYGPQALDRLRFIQGAARLGLRLADIAELLAVRDTGVCPCEPAEELISRRLAELDAEMSRLSALRSEMVAMVEKLPSRDCPAPAPGTWCPTS